MKPAARFGRRFSFPEGMLAGGLSALPPAAAVRKRALYFQEAKIAWIRFTASSTACWLLTFSVTTREMALPQTFSVKTWETAGW